MSYKSKDREDPKQPVEVRTDYRCKAHGCPNTGSIEDLCYYHWMERGSPEKWGSITHDIRMNFERMRNHGTGPVESEAAKQRRIARMWPDRAPSLSKGEQA